VLQAKEIPSDFKSVFSNSVQPSHITILQQWLEDNGLTVTDTKERVSAHLLHHGSNASYSLSFIKTRWVLPAGYDVRCLVVCCCLHLNEPCTLPT
jgi:hypothetical protein